MTKAKRRPDRWTTGSGSPALQPLRRNRRGREQPGVAGERRPNVALGLQGAGDESTGLSVRTRVPGGAQPDDAEAGELGPAGEGVSDVAADFTLFVTGQSRVLWRMALGVSAGLCGIRVGRVPEPVGCTAGEVVLVDPYFVPHHIQGVL